MKKIVRIANKLIGDNQRVFIIAENGINHNGDMEICKKMIDMAIKTGCDAVKFQKRVPELCVPKEQQNIQKETPWGTMTYLDYRKKIEFGEEEYKDIDKYCKEKKIMWFASAWDIPSVDFLEKFDVPCYKVPSACLTNKDLLTKIKNTGKPMILSTGMSTMKQINAAVKLLGEDNLVILHCTSTYPTVVNEHDLNVIKTFKNSFDCPIGYSGHEPGIWPTIIAISLGACVVERHITLDRAMFGSDQAASLEEKGIETICKFGRNIRHYLGSTEKKIYESEKQGIKKLRRVNDI